jgi:cell division GTPase FtsZ
VVAVREANEQQGNDRDRTIRRTDDVDVGLWEPSVRLGQDVRFLLVAVGGGGVRVGRDIARRHLRFVETVAINCDPRVAEAEDFDRRICLGAEDGSGIGVPTSVAAAGQLARAAGPALDRVFEGATFVTVVASLGGGSGTGILGPVLDAASRSAEVLSVFVIKPFAAESERRAVADRAIAGLHFLDAFVEKRLRRQATLTVLDNEELLATDRRTRFREVAGIWAERIATHIEESMLNPVEALVDAERIAALDIGESMARSAHSTPSSIGPAGPPLAPLPVPRAAPPLAAATDDVELTFEVVAPLPGRLDVR